MKMDVGSMGNCGLTKVEAADAIDKVLRTVQNGIEFTIQEYDDNNGISPIVSVTIIGLGVEGIVKISTNIKKRAND